MHCDNLDSEELDKAYREITKEAGVSPNTIKAVLNRAGLDESTSIHSRAELFSEGKTPLQVAITLNLEAEKAIQYHQQYYMHPEFLLLSAEYYYSGSRHPNLDTESET